MAKKTAVDILKSFCHDVALTDQSSDVDELLRTRTRFCHLPADANANDATNYVLMEAEDDIELVSVKIIPSADVSESASVYATLDVNKEDGAGGGLTSLDSIKTDTVANGGTGDWSARVAESFSGIATTDTLDEGELLVLEVTKASTGTALPDCCVVVKYNVL